MPRAAPGRAPRKRRALADDRLEVVRGLDLVLKIEVLLLQAGAFGLGEHTVRDVYPDGAAGFHPTVVAADRLHPQADPQRPAVPALDLHLQPGEFLAGKKPAQQVGRPQLGGRRVSKKVEDGMTVHLVLGATDHLCRPAIDTKNSPITAYGQIAHRCLLVEIAITPFALLEPSLGPQSFQLCGGPCREDPENEQPARFRRHRAVVKDGQMTENIPLAVQEGDAHVAVDAQTDQRRGVREVRRHTRGVMDESPAHDGVAGSGGKIIFHVVGDPITRPKGDGAHSRVHVGKLGDDGVGNFDGRSQSAHQRPEKLLSRATGCPFDDVAERAQIVANRRHVRTFPVGNSQTCLIHLCKQPFAATRLDAHRRPQQSTFVSHRFIRLMPLRFTCCPDMSFVDTSL